MKAAPTALLLAVALAGAAAGFFAYRQYYAARQSAGRIGPMAAPPAEPVTRATPAPAPAALARAIPDEVPDVLLPDLAGRSHRLRAAAGRVRLFNFWATWCEPCRREIPLLNRLQAEHGAEGVEVVGIAVDFRDSVREFLKTTPLHYTLLDGEEDGLDVAQKFGVELVLPFSVFADEHNRIITVRVGELHREQAEAIFASMRQLASGRITPGEARAAISTAMAERNVDERDQSRR